MDTRAVLDAGRRREETIMDGTGPGRGTVRRMDNIAIVVDDLVAAQAFFVELGLELEGTATLEGDGVDRLLALAEETTHGAE